jgi:hypothetical protein
MSAEDVPHPSREAIPHKQIPNEFGSPNALCCVCPTVGHIAGGSEDRRSIRPMGAATGSWPDTSGAAAPSYSATWRVGPLVFGLHTHDGRCSQDSHPTRSWSRRPVEPRSTCGRGRPRPIGSTGASGRQMHTWVYEGPPLNGRPHRGRGSQGADRSAMHRWARSQHRAPLPTGAARRASLTPPAALASARWPSRS